jgi:hypothetical protein
MILLVIVGLSLLNLGGLGLLYEAVTRGDPNCLLVLFFLVPVVVELLLVGLDLCILRRLLMDSSALLLFT